jgi:hypothetical protein
MKKKIYEPPMIIDIDVGNVQALGQSLCGGGNQATSSCSGGGQAVGNCLGGGNPNAGQCGNGNFNALGCRGGGIPSGAGCVDGSKP